MAFFDENNLFTGGISCYNKDNTKGGTRMKDREDKLGLYVHIATSRSRCVYVDFSSLAGPDARIADSQKAPLAHLKETAPSAPSSSVDTIYFGGGTPT